MKMPELPTRKAKAPKQASAGRGVKAPPFLEDIYKDMRDRRLIIPAIALLIAIIALPALLSKDADTTVTVPPTVDDPNAVRVEPAVLAVQEVGVRDFRERLDALKRKNPFGGRFDPKPIDDTTGDLTDPTASGSGAGTDTTSTPTLPDPTDPATTPAGPSPTDPTNPTDPTEPSEPYVLVPRINVEVGIADRDQRETIENVKGGDLLPSRDVPAAMYLGNTDNGEGAELLVSRDVERVGGDGECRPDPDSCEFLRMSEGDRAYLTFIDGKRYVIKVTKIYFEKVDPDKFESNSDDS